MTALSDGLRTLVGVNDPVKLILCNVDSVDTDNMQCDCTPINSDIGSQIVEVNFNAEQGNDSFTIIPSVGSSVVVALSEKGLPYIVAYSGIDTVQAIQGKWVFNNGSFGGLVRVDTLITKINNLESKVNELISLYNSHQHTGVQTGGGTSGTTTAPESTILITTQRTEIENTKITHG